MEVTPDLKTALNFVWVARDVWFNLGLQLNIEIDKLQRISKSRDKHMDMDICVQEMLLVWLDSLPSWEDLATALEQDSVGCTDMAGEIRRKFDLPTKPSISCECYVLRSLDFTLIK